MPGIGVILAGGALAVGLVWWIALKLMRVGSRPGDGTDYGSETSGNDGAHSVAFGEGGSDAGGYGGGD